MRAPEEQDDTDAKLDACLARLDKALPRMHKKIKENGNGKAPTASLGRAAFKKTQEAFEQMRGNPLLTESRDDIEINEEDVEEMKLDPKTIRVQTRKHARNA